MFVNIKYLENLKFNNCENCTKCCENKMFAPLILEDIEKVYKYFPIFIIFLDSIKLVIPLAIDNKCPYLQKDKCSIYENRPPACKLYPFTPWYNELYLDLSCEGIGIIGKKLPLSKEEFKKSEFYENRIENIQKKLKKTNNWLKKQKISFFTKKKNIKIYKINSTNDYYNNLIQFSYKNIPLFF